MEKPKESERPAQQSTTEPLRPSDGERKTHCEHGERIGNFCMGCEQWRMG